MPFPHRAPCAEQHGEREQRRERPSTGAEAKTHGGIGSAGRAAKFRGPRVG